MRFAQVLLDNASETNFITKMACSELKLKIKDKKFRREIEREVNNLELIEVVKLLSIHG
jgi:aspartyl/asparaginyl beta-hydroxylase (cupin superfamily)